MAAVVDHLRAFSQSKDILVKTQPVDCDDEHIIQAEHIVAFHEHHAQTIKSLIRHYKSLEHRFEESETTRKALFAKLEKTETELKASTKAHEATKTELAGARKDLASTKETLKTTEQKLTKTRDELKTSEGKLQKANEDLKATTAKLEPTQSKLATKEADHKKLSESYKNARKDVEKLEKDLEKEQLRSDTELTALREQKDKEINKLRKELSRLRDVRQELDDLEAEGSKAAAATFMKQPGHSRDDVYIDEVIYGGVNIKDLATIKKLLDFAVSGKEFTIINDLLGGDPWVGTKKTFTAVYSLDGKGPFRHWSCQEGQTARFA